MKRVDLQRISACEKRTEDKLKNSVHAKNQFLKKMLEKSIFQENEKKLKKIVFVQRISFGSEPRRRQY